MIIVYTSDLEQLNIAALAIQGPGNGIACHVPPSDNKESYRLLGSGLVDRKMLNMEQNHSQNQSVRDSG